MVLKHSLKGWALLESTRVLAKRLRCNLSVKLLYVTKDGLTSKTGQVEMIHHNQHKDYMYRTSKAESLNLLEFMAIPLLGHSSKM